MDELLPLMSVEARGALKKLRDNARFVEKGRQLKATRVDKAEKQYQRRCSSAADAWAGRAALLQIEIKKLEKGMSVLKFVRLDGDSIDKVQASEKQVAKMRTQCQFVRAYLKKLQKRNLAKETELRAAGAAASKRGVKEAALYRASEAAALDLVDRMDLTDELEDEDVEEAVPGAKRKFERAHDIADEVIELLGTTDTISTGRALREWVSEWMKHESFGLDMRGTWSPEHLLDDEDVLQHVRDFMLEKAAKAGADGLSVESFWKFCNTELLVKVSADAAFETILAKLLTTNEEGKYTISKTTAHNWMLRCGAEQNWFRPGYYTDMHQRPDVIEMRIEYLYYDRKLCERTPSWVQIPKHEYDTLRQGVGWIDVDKDPHHYLNDAGEEMVEIHADQFEETDGARWEGRTVSVKFCPEAQSAPAHPGEGVVARCENGHDLTCGICKCHCEVYRLGQDEAVYKAYSLPKGVWVICGVQSMRKKSDGPGEMVSGFVDEHRGWGLDLSVEELRRVNEFRAEKGRAPLECSPGLRFLTYGKNKDGYWTAADFEKQTIDVLDVLEVLEPTKQIVIEVDYSQGHAKMLVDALHVNKLNLKIGGNRQHKRVLRDSFMRVGCLAAREPDEVVPAGMLKLGDTQHFDFREGDTVYPGEAAKYAGEAFPLKEPKGTGQILWERGLWTENMKLVESKQVLSRCLDFVEEKTALETLLLDRGHLLIMSPKGHPELAGLGVEYCWGKSKRDYRQLNDCVPRHLHDNIVKSFACLDVARCRRFARRSREYKRAYARVHMLFGYDEDDALVGLKAVEKYVKHCSTHRCTADQDAAFLAAN